MSSPSSLLVYTDGEVIGDGILRLAFVQALKKAAPQVRITWLASGGSVYNTVLRAMAEPLIDELIVLPDHALPLTDYMRRPAVLRGRKFDVIIDTQRKFKRSLWLTRIRHRRFISTAAKGLFSSVTLPSLSPHFLTRTMQLGELALGTALTLEPLTLPPGNWQAHAAELLPEGKRYIGFIVGAGHPDKRWPLEQFIALAQDVAARGDVPVIFLGPQEMAQRAEILAAVPSAIVPLVGGAAPSPYFTIALGARLAAAVANDSGGGHLLAAGGAPLVSLFRADSVRTKFLPNAPRVIALAPEDFGVATMQEIPLEAVSQALHSLRG